MVVTFASRDQGTWLQHDPFAHASLLLLSGYATVTGCSHAKLKGNQSHHLL
jgi:hypothetical protein